MSSGRWWRAYNEARDDPKLQRLDGELFKAWFNIMCIASDNDGNLPPVDDVAFKLGRLSVPKTRKILDSLMKAGLIDDVNGVLCPHNWSGRQYKSDVSTTRVKRFRERQRNVSLTVSETPPDTDTERKKKDTASAVSLTEHHFAFESGVIRLDQRDFDRWKAAFSHLDLKAELVGLTQWAGDQGPKWFHAVSGALAKRNRDLGVKIEAAKVSSADSVLSRQRAEFDNPNAGIL